VAEQKTKPTDADVNTYLDRVSPDQKREDCFRLLDLFEKISGESPKLWNGSIIGFGSYHYRYASGRKGDWFLVGFAPRKAYLSLYLMDDQDWDPATLKKLGKCKTGKCCLNIKKLSDIDLKVLVSMLIESVKKARERLR